MTVPPLFAPAIVRAAATATPTATVTSRSVFGFDYPEGDFYGYLSAFLSHLMPIIMLFAVVMVIYSGVQYLTSPLQPDNAKKAKERVIGILYGVVFYFIMAMILKSLSSDFDANIKVTFALLRRFA